MVLNRKVIITGNFGVGKTSLFRRFIENTFSDKYITTIGVKVDKKVIKIGDEEVNILLWDLAGEVKQDKIPTAYFIGTSAIIYVFDVTRPLTYKNLVNDIKLLKTLVPGVIIKIVGNKKDLLSKKDLEILRTKLLTNPPNFFTSAKSGENVQELFEFLAKEFLAIV